MHKLAWLRRMISFGALLLPSCGPANGGPEDGTTRSLAGCLPDGIKLSDIVQATATQKITVEQKLRELEARCDATNKLVDENGRPIAFYQLTGCWSMPPPNYLEIMQEQRRALARLRRGHTVVEMTCNPSGVHRP